MNLRHPDLEAGALPIELHPYVQLLCLASSSGSARTRLDGGAAPSGRASRVCQVPVHYSEEGFGV